MVTQGDVRQTSKKKKLTYHIKKLYSDVKNTRKKIFCVKQMKLDPFPSHLIPNDRIIFIFVLAGNFPGRSPLNFLASNTWVNRAIKAVFTRNKMTRRQYQTPFANVI